MSAPPPPLRVGGLRVGGWGTHRPVRPPWLSVVMVLGVALAVPALLVVLWAAHVRPAPRAAALPREVVVRGVAYQRVPTVPTAPLPGTRWAQVGSWAGHRLLAVAPVATPPTTVYLQVGGGSVVAYVAGG